jgi:hypothetical protein
LDLVEFFEEFICGRWYIYLEQTMYHLCRPISCWLSCLAVEYHLLWTIISYVVWYSSPADDIQLKQMILIPIWRGWYSSRADDIHPMETIFIQEKRISSMMVDFWHYNQPLGMIINHWGWTSAEIDDISSALDEYIIWCIVCSRWIYHLPQMNLSKKLSRSQLSAKKDIKHPFLR